MLTTELRATRILRVQVFPCVVGADLLCGQGVRACGSKTCSFRSSWPVAPAREALRWFPWVRHSHVGLLGDDFGDVLANRGRLHGPRPNFRSSGCRHGPQGGREVEPRLHTFVSLSLRRPTCGNWVAWFEQASCEPSVRQVEAPFFVSQANSNN